MVCTVALASCAPEAQPPLKFFSVGRSSADTAAAPNVSGRLQGTSRLPVLRLAPVTGDALFQDRGVCYSDAPNVVATYTLGQWVTAPVRQVQDLLALALEQTHAFRAVVFAGSQAGYDYVLETRLLDFCFYIRDSKGGEARVSMLVSLVDPASGDVACSAMFSGHEVAASVTADEAAAALGRAAMRLSERISQWSLQCVKAY